MANAYTLGTLVRCTATFSFGGSNIDPTAVTATLKDPSGVETSPAVVHDATGAYHFDFTPTLPGVHYYRFNGTGTVIVAAENAFVALPTHS